MIKDIDNKKLQFYKWKFFETKCANKNFLEVTML